MNVVNPPAVGQIPLQAHDLRVEPGELLQRRISRRTPRRLSTRPVAPARSACFCHLRINVEYKPSPRRNPARSALGSASNSARILVLYDAEKV